MIVPWVLLGVSVAANATLIVRDWRLDAKLRRIERLVNETVETMHRQHLTYL